MDKKDFVDHIVGATRTPQESIGFWENVDKCEKLENGDLIMVMWDGSKFKLSITKIKEDGKE